MLHTIRTMAERNQYVEAFSTGKLGHIVFVGPPGVSKSQSLRDELGERAILIPGTISPVEFYIEVFLNRHLEFIILDDADSFFDTLQGRQLIMSLTDSIRPTSICWKTRSKILEQEGVPRSFSSNARLAILTNKPVEQNKKLAALVNRCKVVICKFSALEVHRDVGAWWPVMEEGENAWDEEVYDFIGENLHLIREPDMRTYLGVSHTKRLGISGWRQAVLETFGLSEGEQFIVLALKESPVIVEEIASEFVRKGYGCRATFFNWKSRLESNLVAVR